MMRWFDAQGGHLEAKGLSPSGEVISVPLHRHHVRLNVLRVDVGLKYHVNTNWRLEANVPYEVKEQEATVEEISDYPLTAAELAAIERNRDIHHRNETYSGIRDVEALLGYNAQGVLMNSDVLTARIGTTVPLGKTEADPWKLGVQGLKHQHIQFGTGTFDPIADLYYYIPLYGNLAANASLRGKLPFYENSKTYRGSRELTYTAGLNYQFTDGLSLQAGYFGFYQSFAYWAGERDINSGLRFSMASLGASVLTSERLTLSLTAMLPLQQETLYDDSNAFLDGEYVESDAFEFGPLISLTALYAF